MPVGLFLRCVTSADMTELIAWEHVRHEKQAPVQTKAEAKAILDAMVKSSKGRRRR